MDGSQTIECQAEASDEIADLLAADQRHSSAVAIGMPLAMFAPFFILMSLGWSGTIQWALVPLLAVIIMAVVIPASLNVQWRSASRMSAICRPGDQRVFNHISRYQKHALLGNRARRAIRGMILSWPTDSWQTCGDESAKSLIQQLARKVRSRDPSSEDSEVARASVRALAEISTSTACQGLSDVARSRPVTEQMESVRALAEELLPDAARRLEHKKQGEELLRPADDTETLLRPQLIALKSAPAQLLRANDDCPT
jgi:hypothetical protein